MAWQLPGSGATGLAQKVQTALPALVVTTARKHGLDRLHHDQNIQPDRKVADVVKVILQLQLDIVDTVNV